MRRSELGRLRLERERREKERREREAKEVAVEPEIIVPVPSPTIQPSILGGLVQEAIKRKEKEPKVKEIDEEMAMRLRVREETINEINETITPNIENSLDVLEEESLRFGSYADDRNTEGMLTSLESFQTGLLQIKEELKRFHSKLTSVQERTGRAEDKGWVIKDTFNPAFIKKRVRDNLDLLKGTADAILDVNLAITGARRPVRALQNIFDIGTADFGFDKHEIVIEMDVSRDEEFAKNLAETLAAGGPPIFTPIGGPMPGEPGFLSTTRRNLSLTPSRKALDLSAAKKIVAAHDEVEPDTLRAILEAQGFPNDIILEALAPLKEPILPEIKRRRPLPPSFGVTTRPTEPRPIGEPLRESRLPAPPPEIDLSTLSTQDLVNLAKDNGLKEYRRKKKPGLIRYLTENLDNAILAAAVRKKQFNLSYTNLPVIFIG